MIIFYTFHIFTLTLLSIAANAQIPEKFTCGGLTYNTEKSDNAT